MPIKENLHQCTSKIGLPNFCQMDYLENLDKWVLRFYGDSKYQFSFTIVYCPMCGLNLLDEGIRYCPFDGDKLKHWMRGSFINRFKCPTCDRDYLYHTGKDWFTLVTEEIAKQLENGELI